MSVFQFTNITVAVVASLLFHLERYLKITVLVTYRHDLQLSPIEVGSIIEVTVCRLFQCCWHTDIPKQFCNHGFEFIEYILFNLRSTQNIDFQNLEINEFLLLFIWTPEKHSLVDFGLVGSNWKWTQIWTKKYIL